MSALYPCNGTILVPLVLFGQTWLREAEVREALGFSLPSHFRRVVEDADLYRDSLRTLIAEGEGGGPERAFSINGALQLALYVCRYRRGEALTRVQDFIDTLYEMRNPSFVRSAA